MKAFCTSCGTELGADTRFCIRCGTENPAPAKAKKDRRWLWWVLALILVFILGFLLGKMLAPKCPACPATAAAGGGGGGGGGRDDPGGVGGLNAGSGDGDLPGGGGGKKHPDGTPPDQTPGSAKDADQASGDLLKLTQGKPLTADDDDEKPAPDAPPVKSFTSHDFTYDKTGLPHYPDAVKAVVSSITYEVPDRTDAYRTGAGIVTASPFATLVDWYQKNLPGGWRRM